MSDKWLLQEVSVRVSHWSKPLEVSRRWADHEVLFSNRSFRPPEQVRMFNLTHERWTWHRAGRHARQWRSDMAQFKEDTATKHFAITLPFDVVSFCCKFALSDFNIAVTKALELQSGCTTEWTLMYWLYISVRVLQVCWRTQQVQIRGQSP